MKKLVTSLALAAVLASGSAAMAQTATTSTSVAVPSASVTAQPAGVVPPVAAVPGHPRVQEIDQRLDNQQTRIDNGVNAGQMNAKQELRDEKTDAKVSQELSADEAKNGGKITKAEDARMNKQLNKNSHRIHHQRTKGAVTPASTTPAAQ